MRSRQASTDHRFASDLHTHSRPQSRTLPVFNPMMLTTSSQPTSRRPTGQQNVCTYKASLRVVALPFNVHPLHHLTRADPMASKGAQATPPYIVLFQTGTNSFDDQSASRVVALSPECGDAAQNTSGVRTTTESQRQPPRSRKKRRVVPRFWTKTHQHDTRIDFVG